LTVEELDQIDGGANKSFPKPSKPNIKLPTDDSNDKLQFQIQTLTSDFLPDSTTAQNNYPKK
jgi:hypothetical protein